MRLFDIGFQQVGEITVVGVAATHLSFEFGEPLVTHVAPPRSANVSEDVLGEFRRTPDAASVEKSEGDAEIIGRHPGDLFRRPHGVVETETLVPDGIPERLGKGADTAMR